MVLLETNYKYTVDAFYPYVPVSVVFIVKTVSPDGNEKT